MRFSPRVLAIIQLGVAVWSALSPQMAFAYDHPLSDDAVREAYFLGQDVERANTFLSQYTQMLPVPASGPDVSEIELSTPYAQVVEVSAQHSVSYSAQQAAEDYRKRGDFIAVRVKILFTPTYSGGDEEFWRSVSVGLVQKQHMGATRVDGQPIYGDGCVLIGADVFVQFSVASVKSDPVQVEVLPPGGPAVHATFDLSNLR